MSLPSRYTPAIGTTLSSGTNCGTWQIRFKFEGHNPDFNYWLKVQGYRTGTNPKTYELWYPSMTFNVSVNGGAESVVPLNSTVAKQNMYRGANQGGDGWVDVHNHVDGTGSDGSWSIHYNPALWIKITINSGSKILYEGNPSPSQYTVNTGTHYLFASNVKIYNGGWKNAIPYIYYNGWQPAATYIYNGEWNLAVSNDY